MLGFEQLNNYAFLSKMHLWLSLCLSWTTSLSIKKLTHGARHHAMRQKKVSVFCGMLSVCGFFPHVSPWPVSLWNKMEISRLLFFLSRISSYLWKWDFLGKDHNRGQCFLCPVPELQERVHRPGLLHPSALSVTQGFVCVMWKGPETYAWNEGKLLREEKDAV